MAQYGNYIFNLSEKVIRKPISYKNRFGIQIAADLYLPKDFDENKKYPALIMDGPYSTVKEQVTGFYANEMCQRGFIALAFDHSYNGYSGGHPRHVCSPDIFLEDISAGVDYLGTRSFVNREQIGAIGLCAGGGFVLSTAQVDKRIKAIVTLSMYDASRYDFLSDDMRNAMLDDLAEQRYIDFEGPYPTMGARFAPIHFNEHSDSRAQEVGGFYSTERGYHHNCLTSFTATSVLSMMNYSLLKNIKKNIKWISPRPILIIAGENASVRFHSEDVYNAAGDSKELYIVPNVSHCDLYDKVDIIPFDKIEAFFSKIKN